MKDNKTDICFVITNGFSLRMLTQTNLLGLLKLSGIGITLISVGKQIDKNILEYSNRNNIKCIGYFPKRKFSEYLFARKYFDLRFDDNYALKEKHYYATKVSKPRHPWKRIRPYIYNFFGLLSKRVNIVKTMFYWYERKVILENKKIRNVISEICPQILVSTYPVDVIESTFLYEAKKQNIVTLTHLLSWDNITCKGQFPVVTDYFISWGKVMENEIKSYYNITQDRIFNCGVAHFDVHFKTLNSTAYEKLLVKLDLDPKMKYIVFAMSAPYFAPAEIDIVEYLANKIETNEIKDVQLLVRPHPQTVSGYLSSDNWIVRLNRIGKFTKTSVHFPLLHKNTDTKWSLKTVDMEEFSNLLEGCSLIINSGSTVSIDAMYHGKNTIITSFDGNEDFDFWKSSRRLIKYPHLKKFIKLDSIVTVFNYKELEMNILELISNPSDEVKIRKELSNYSEITDGNSTEALREVYVKLLNEERIYSKVYH